MRPQQRKDIVKAFDNASLKSSKSSQPSDNHYLPSNYQSANYSQPSTSYASISISSDDSGITTIPIVVLQDMWRKAGRLIADCTAVTPAPGSNPKSKMVLSSVPHFFQYKGNGRFACDSSCLHWKSSGICSHSIAAAETVGDLSEFLKWFVSSTQAPNITAISMDGLSSGRGRKGRRPKRQKGKRHLWKQVLLVITRFILLLLLHRAVLHIHKAMNKVFVTVYITGTLHFGVMQLSILLERRSFKGSTGTLVTPRHETVCHYHCSFYCIRSVEPSFCPSTLLSKYS